MPSDPLLNIRIGNVKLTRRLGAGAMGVVYQGWHEAFAQEVAVKFLTAASGNSRERFIREGRAAARIENEHVIRVLDAGEAAGQAYLVLEFVNGRSLGEILDAQKTADRQAPPADRPSGSLPEPGVVAHLGAQIARGLAAIHAKGIVHRDIKPDNVLVSHEGRAKIADLGLAKQLDDAEALRLTGTGMVVGTPLYVSPEGIRDPKSISGASDVYSLGATLYHLLSGRPPFDGKTAYAVMRCHLEEKFQPLRELRPDLPPHLVQLVERCLAKQPDRRPSPHQLCEQLEGRNAADGGSALVRGAAVLMAALALTAGTGWWWLRQTASGADATAPTAQLALKTDHPQLLARVDGGDWQPLSGPLTVAAGRRRIEVKAHQSGPLLRWSEDIEVAAGTQIDLPLTLTIPRIAPLRIAAPGTAGMSYVDGRAYDTQPQITLQNPGLYHLGRWDGALWTTRTVSVDESGTVSEGTPATADHPDGPAWFVASDDRGRPCPPHHRVSWWEAEQLRAKLQLTEPPGWREQGVRPEQPAEEFGLKLLAPLCDALIERKLGRLPTVAEATVLAELLQAPIWAQGKLLRQPVGGRPAKAQIVLLPE
jgi:hypothetical protein